MVGSRWTKLEVPEGPSHPTIDERKWTGFARCAGAVTATTLTSGSTSATTSGVETGQTGTWMTASEIEEIPPVAPALPQREESRAVGNGNREEEDENIHHYSKPREQPTTLAYELPVRLGDAGPTVELTVGPPASYTETGKTNTSHTQVRTIIAGEKSLGTYPIREVKKRSSRDLQQGAASKGIGPQLLEWQLGGESPTSLYNIKYREVETPKTGEVIE